MKKALCILLLFMSLFVMSVAQAQSFIFSPASNSEAVVDENRVLKLVPDQLIIAKGKSGKLTPSYDQDTYGKNAKYSWSSSDAKIASVSSSGNIQGISIGDATITCHATFKDGTEAENVCKVTVYQPVQSFSVKNASLKVFAKKTADAIEYTIKPDNASYQTIDWSTSDKSIATVDSKGRITGVAGGKATITGKLNEPGVKEQKSIKIQVTVTESVSSIKLSSTNVTIGKGKTRKLTAEVLPSSATNTKVTWSSDDDRIASVSNGTITGKKAGKCTIIATAADGSGVKATCRVTVIQQVTSIKHSQNRRFVQAGETLYLSVDVSPSDATNKKINWSSDNTYLATVDHNGVVTGKNEGTCKIYAESTDGSGIKASVTVVVEPYNPISLDSIGHGVYQYNLLALTVTNRCQMRVIKDFNFDMTMYDYMGNVINSGSYSLGGTPITLGAGRSQTIKRNVYGAGQAYRTTITITGVLFSDGEEYTIPRNYRETWSFSR